MKLPFTSQEFLELFKKYNLFVWPMQIVFCLIAILAIFLNFRKNETSSRVISVILAFFWLWMGIVYNLLFFSSINKAAYLFATVFIIQGFVFLIQGGIRNQFSFKFPRNIYGLTGSVLIIFALFVYPVIGSLQGHVYPYSPTFGLPCPTTIFTLGLLLWIDQKLNFSFFWSAIGFMAALQLGIKEDVSLLFAGVISLILFLSKRKLRSESAGA
jgi:hypothetical protein